jgi:superfamily II DNA or RNA helicase
MNNDNIQKRLEAVLKRCEELQNENARLKKQLGIVNSIQRTNRVEGEITLPQINSQVPKEEKISLFKNLFCGREDIFAVRWEGRDGKAGYSPLCTNLWRKGLCNKAKINCSKCPNKAYLPLTGQEIHKHLTGKLVIGLYPMLKDEACRLLVVDFDKESWADDIQAYRSACEDTGIPVAIERSRSGKGGHAWIFFDEAVSARDARKLGFWLLTMAMEKRHQIGFDSYDRMFPNQDTMPKGGFGNLIALPLQYQARQQGNTVFLDKQMEPYQDQWEYLAYICKVGKSALASLLKGVVDIGPIAEDVQENVHSNRPWDLPGSSIKNSNHQPITPTVDITLSNSIYINKAGLPSWAINRLFRMAAFPNPEFYQAQALRLPTYDKPRIISCGEEFPGHIALPRGLLDEAVSFFTSNNSCCNIADLRNQGREIDAGFTGLLDPAQQAAAEAILSKNCGVLSAATAFGKTVVAASVIARRGVNTLILVHRQQLMDQWHERLKVFLIMNSGEIGRIGGGRDKAFGMVDIAMIQSLLRMDDIDVFIRKYGQIIIDECHHIPAFSFEKVVKRANARYVVGLTATPIRKDGHHPIIAMQCGPVVHKIGARESQALSGLQCRVFAKMTSFIAPADGQIPIQEIYRMLAADEQRNETIFGDILDALERKRSPLVLTERREHLELLYGKLRNFAKNIVVFHGGMSKKKRQTVMEQLRAIPPGEERLILATGRYIGEGFDDARLDTLFITLPIAWRGTLPQYAGRLHRRKEGKTNVFVYDYRDAKVPVLERMYVKRVKGYKAMGYEINGAV